MKNYKVGAACLAVTAALTGYLALDTFVFQSVYQTDAISSDASSVFSSLQQNMSSGTTSTDGTADKSDSDDTADESQNADAGGTSSSESSSSSGSTSSTSDEESSTTESTSSSSHGPHSHDGKPGSQGFGSGGHGPGKSDSSSSSSGSANSNSGSSSGSDIEDTVESVSTASEEYESYSDDNVQISVKEYTVNNTQVYVADVQVSSAEYLKTAFANNSFGHNVTAKTSEMAAENNAILAINGDYYGAQETGYVIRNGQVYRSTSSGDEDVLCIYADGSMKIVSTADYSADELVEQGVWQAFSFGPALVEDGKLVVDAGDETGKAMASNPRTAIGVIDENHYLFVVSDGRTDESEGLSLSALGEFMQSLGATCAYNLDGGGSSTMYYQGSVINNPTTTGKISEREVSDIVYIG